MKRGVGTTFDIVSFAVVSTFLAFAALVLSSRNMVLAKQIKKDTTRLTPGKPIFARAIIDSLYIVPVAKEESKATTFASTLAGLFSSFYKDTGYSQKYMKEDQYLQFSAQHIDKILAKHPKATDLQELSHVKSITDDLLHPIGSNSAVKFSFNVQFKSSNIRDIKQKIVEANYPIAIKYTKLQERYFFPCTLDLYKSSKSCEYSQTTPETFEIPFLSSSDYTFSRSGKQIPVENETLLIVGYSDEYSPKSFVNISQKENTKGAFFVRTNNCNHGHTSVFLSNLLTSEEERILCPNLRNPMNWVPTTLQCLKDTKDPSKCQIPQKFKRGNKTVTFADTLICTNSKYCDTSSKYALIGYDRPLISFSNTGVPLATIAKISDDNVVSEVLETLPFQHLNLAFTIKDFQENSKFCGYSALMYDELDTIIQSGTGTWIAYGVQATFPSSAYSKEFSKYYSKFSL
ncbi:hypothetical protein TVAG_375200 [Trichomonas vaginalis G3]|uniref:Uncharacterized protein n=1 Tax=Trichomonas vaginalis (strain ATCC PRA-98 / G3) TaxID=412133 RepID=A2FGZ8_TRIV3|nr:papain family cysteine protease domain containing protein family [Trichomonas vaginalis G3]EAX95811.1 hypothetical protein TVAG_375200 [Trichomonas vaginalis G3]KAI5500545.1 papain family cysteine protease domain containing protein family [Trichomonas vaginalis G3]|eukprot:XP_001308741.1 hypothetical protein [Trichomonas vaginalis G3]